MKSRLFGFVLFCCLVLFTGRLQAQSVSITSAAPPNGIVGTAYNYTYTATDYCDCDYVPVWQWSVSSGSLPAGLSLNPSTGVVSGSPTTSGAFSYTIIADDTANENENSRTDTITVFAAGDAFYVLAPYIDPETDVIAISATGTTTLVCSGAAPYDACYNANANDFARDSSGNFVIAAGSVLVSMTPAGTSTIIPTGNGEYDFVSVAIDASGNYIVAENNADQLLRIPPGGGTPVVIASYGLSYDNVVRVDSNGNYIVAYDDGSDAATASILRITPGGTVSNLESSGNWPSTVGGLTFDALGNYVLTDWYNAQVFTITPSGLGSFLYGGEALSEPLGITRDNLTGNFLIADNGNDVLYQLSPNGSTITQVASLSNPIGVIAGSLPPAPASAPQLQISGTTNLGDNSLGKPISGSFYATGGQSPYTFSATGLPSGMSFTAGALSGTPTAPGFYNFQVSVSDAAGHTASTGVNFTVLGFSSGSLPPANTYTPYSTTVTASGGYQPYTYSGSGAPSGITISSTGVISGTTLQTGTFSLVISVTDNSGVQSSGTFTLTVNSPLQLSVQGGTISATTVQTPVSQGLTATGGAPPYNWSVVAGALPSGLTLQPAGTVRGIPSKSGTYNFTVQATDSTGGHAVGSYSMTILPAGITVVTPSPLANGMLTVDYPVQPLSASGGVPPYLFAVTSGSLPAGLALDPTGSISGIPTASGTSSFTITVSDSSTPALTGAANLSIAVRPFAPDLILSSGSVSFSLVAGTAVLPGSQTVQVEATDVTQVLGYSAVVSSFSATWLGISSSAGNTPGSFAISLTNAALSLAASTTPYQAAVVVTCTTGPCKGNTQTVNVLLTVANLPPQLTLVNDSLAFNTQSSAPTATTQTLGIENSGGGSIGFASITCGAPWCKVGNAADFVGAGATASIPVTADPTGLAAGYYWTDVAIVSSAGSAVVPVTFLIAANGLITLAPAGAEFTLPQGGAAVGDTSITVSVSGTAAVSFNTQVSSSAPWLSVTPTSGTASGTQPANLNLVFDQTKVAALTPGTYYGTVQISSAGAVNSPQSYEVVLNVTAATQRTKPNPVPGGLIFLTQATNTPPAQTVTVYSGSPTAIGYQASASTNTGGNWLTVSPATGSTSSATPATSSVSVKPNGLAPGVYTGSVSYAFSSTAVRSVNVTLIVEAPIAAAPSLVSQSEAHPAQTSGTTCTPTQIVPTSTALVSNFAAPASWPIELAVQLYDNCGSPLNNGQVVATFSNLDPPLVLSPANAATGFYDGTWTPRRTSAQIVINARVTAPGFPTATLQIAGAVTPNNVPVLAHNSIANFYNPVGGAPLAPGTLVQITGQYLAGQTLSNTSIPIPTTLGGTSVIIGGIEAPVTYVSPGQVNAQVPFELPAGQPYQVIVNANGALTTPDGFEAGTVSPGLSVLPNGYIRANHDDGTVVTDQSPAKPGEYIAVYLVGMGPTNTPVSSGAPAPSNPLATVTIPPSITVNGEGASYIFAGLAPGLVGAYQVNLQVPADAINGDLVLTFSEDGINSNSAILPVHN
jgi:uncharacterized protein (TIGR03437 family)